MGDNLDFSVDNYSLEDLLEIFGIEGPIPQNEIIERGSKMIEKYRQAKKPEHVTFFSTATNKLLSNYQNIETFLNRVPESEEEDDSDSEEDNESLDGKEGFVGGSSPKENAGGNTNYVINVGGDKKHVLPAENVWKNNLYNTQSTRNTMNSYMMPERTANVKVPVNLDHSVQLPKKLLLPNAYSQVPYLQGTMNPTLQNTYLTWVNVDSQYRELIVKTDNSTSCLPTLEPAEFDLLPPLFPGSSAKPPPQPIYQKDSSTDFMFTLSSPVTNVLSMTLGSLEVPLNGYYVFSEENGNTTFNIRFNWKSPNTLGATFPSTAPANINWVGNSGGWHPTHDISNSAVFDDSGKYLCTQIPDGNYESIRIGGDTFYISTYISAAILARVGPIPNDISFQVISDFIDAQNAQQDSPAVGTSTGDSILTFIMAFQQNENMYIVINGNFDWWRNQMLPITVPTATYRAQTTSITTAAPLTSWSPLASSGAGAGDIFSNFIYCWNEIVCNWAHTDLTLCFGGGPFPKLAAAEKPSLTFEEFLKLQPGYEDLCINGGFGNPAAAAADPFDHRTLEGYWHNKNKPTVLMGAHSAPPPWNYYGTTYTWDPRADSYPPNSACATPPPPHPVSDQIWIPAKNIGDTATIPPFALNQVQLYVLYYIQLILVPEAAEKYKTWWENKRYPQSFATAAASRIKENSIKWLWYGGIFNSPYSPTHSLPPPPPPPHHVDNGIPVLPWPFPFTFSSDYYDGTSHGSQNASARSISPGFLPKIPDFDIQWYVQDDKNKGQCQAQKCPAEAGSSQYGYGKHKLPEGQKLNNNLGWKLGFRESISAPKMNSFRPKFTGIIYPDGLIEYALVNEGFWDTADTDPSGVIVGAPPWIYLKLIACITRGRSVELETLRTIAYHKLGPLGLKSSPSSYPEYWPPFDPTATFSQITLSKESFIHGWNTGVGSILLDGESRLVPIPEGNLTSQIVNRNNTHACRLWLGMQAECVANLNGTNYMTLIIDDFIQNRYSGNMPSFSVPFQTFKTPSYAKRYESSMPICRDKNGNIIFRDGKHGPTTIARKCRQGTPNPNDIIDGSNNLTNSQKWTAQQIAHRQKLPPINQVISPTLTNVLIRVPVNRQQVSQGGLLVVNPDYSTASGGRSIGRRYYGPVTLKRFRIQLVDDIGHPLNLNCGNISFSLVLERLYQY